MKDSITTVTTRTKGKRTAKTFTTGRADRQLRWYVSGKLFRTMEATLINVALASKWMSE